MFKLLELPYLGAIRKLLFSLELRHPTQSHSTKDESRSSSEVGCYLATQVSSNAIFI